MTQSLKHESIHFVTGRLAEPAVQQCVAKLSNELGFEFTIDVLPITVAALITPKWLLRHISIPSRTTRVIVPGYLESGIDELRAALAVPVECGPRDIRELPSHFGKKVVLSEDFGQHSIEILAEINHAPRLTIEQTVIESKRLVADGADIIDLGCDPGSTWHRVGDTVKALRDEGIRCSIDTFNPIEAMAACNAGAKLVLSVNSSNISQAIDWGAEVVVIPDSTKEEKYLASLEGVVETLANNKVPFRIDPILEPIGCGFAASLLRYHQVRRHFPDAPMMMGIGNITELTDCDSAGLNLLLLAICEEWKIHSVLTTQVITWAQSSVRECAAARELVAYSLRHRVPPKKLDRRLIQLRDSKVFQQSAESIAELATKIKDNNYRIFVGDGQLHLVAAHVHIRGTDPFEMIDELLTLPESKNVDAGHAFYLGFELSKALTALTLGKNYDQDVALAWGLHTRPEKHRRLSKRGDRKGMKGT